MGGCSRAQQDAAARSLDGEERAGDMDAHREVRARPAATDTHETCQTYLNAPPAPSRLAAGKERAARTRRKRDAPSAPRAHTAQGQFQVSFFEHRPSGAR